MRCAIVLRDFEVLGRMPVPADLKTGPPAKRLKVEELDLDNVSSKGVDEDAESKGVDEDAEDKVSTPTVCSTKCSGSKCSKHGISFSVCLAKCVPIHGVSLSRIAKECVFVTRQLKDMTNKDKRFLLYYYYATSVFQFHGKGNRVELPDCIVSEVREAYPGDK